jgi:hypothetical protein
LIPTYQATALSSDPFTNTNRFQVVNVSGQKLTKSASCQGSKRAIDQGANTEWVAINQDIMLSSDQFDGLSIDQVTNLPIHQAIN